MGFLSKFEGKMEDTVEGAADKLGGSPLSPVQIAKKCEKQMRREKMVGAGKQYAPTLYTILVSQSDDSKLFGYYPTLAGETETYLTAKAQEHGFVMDGQPLVRFIPDEGLKHGKFEVIAEMVAAPLVEQLRLEEMERYGIAAPRNMRSPRGGMQQRGGMQRPAARPQRAAAVSAAERDPFEAQPQEVYAAAADAAGMAGAAGVAGAAGMAGAASGMGAGSAAGVAAAGAAGAAAAGVAGAMAGAMEDTYGAEPKTMMFGEQPVGAGAGQPANFEVYLYDEVHDIAYQLTGRPQSIGRESKNDIVVSDINASRVHAEIRMEPTGAWVLADLGSTNGTYVNNRRIKSIQLHDADMIMIGSTELEFQQL